MTNPAEKIRQIVEEGVQYLSVYGVREENALVCMRQVLNAITTEIMIMERESNKEAIETEDKDQCYHAYNVGKKDALYHIFMILEEVRISLIHNIWEQ